MAQFRNTRLAAILVAGTALAGCEEFAALVEMPEAQTTAAAPAAARQTQSAPAGAVAAVEPEPARFVPRNNPNSDRSTNSSVSSASEPTSISPSDFGGGFDAPSPADPGPESWN